MRPVEEQVVVITGASSGIGRCAALYLAGRGARVAMFARRKDALDDLARDIVDRGGDAIAVAGDVPTLPTSTDSRTSHSIATAASMRG